MNDATAAVAEALKLPDEAFFAASTEPFDRIEETLAPDPFAENDAAPAASIFALGLPRTFDVGRVAAIPGVLMMRYQGPRLWEARFRSNVCFIVLDLRTGQLRSVNPFQPDKRMAAPARSRSGPEPDAVARGSTNYGFRRFDLPSIFGPGWPSDRFAVTAIWYDWVSNTVVVERQPQLEPRPEPARGGSPFLTVSPPTQRPPGGLAVRVHPRVTGVGTIPVAGTVIAQASDVALALSTEEADGRIMIAHVLLMRLDRAEPYIVTIGVPVTRRDAMVGADFAFDLAKLPEAASLTGEYQVYLVSGRTVAGPQPMVVGR